MTNQKRTLMRLLLDGSAVLGLLRNSGLPQDAMADLEAGRAKLLPLSKGNVTLVDAGLFAALAVYNWHIAGNGYACRWQNNPSTKAKKFLIMHRVIIEAPDNLIVDHINCCKLDNRRSNLRLATFSQNNFNQRLSPNSASGLKGASWHKNNKRWQAVINFNGRTIYLGNFASKGDAHLAYCEAAKRLFGDFWRKE